MSKTKKRPSGHPAKQDPDVDQLFRVMKLNVLLVQKLQDRLTPEGHLNLKAAALGNMHAYAELTGLPDPTAYYQIEEEAA